MTSTKKITTLFNEIEDELKAEKKHPSPKKQTKNNSIANIFDELNVKTPNNLFDNIETDSDEIDNLFTQFAESIKPTFTNNIMVDQLNYNELLDRDNVDPKFTDTLNQVVSQAAEAGEIFQFSEGLRHTQKPVKFRLFRFKPENIDKLVSFIETEWNPSREEFIHPKPVKIICPDIEEANPLLNFPNMIDFNINPNAEACIRKCHHTVFDIETNKHQQLFAEKYLDKEIEGGVKGNYYAEAKRYLKFYHVRKKNDRKIKVYRTIDDKGIFINFWGTNPKEGLKLCAIELTISQILLSSMMDGQKELISIFKQVAEKIPFPINASILKKYLFHELYNLFMCHNANFDQNRIIDTFQRHKQKGNHILLEKVKPESLEIMHGNIKETIDKEARYFTLPMGNILAGTRDKFRLDTSFLSKGKPEIFIGPVQSGAAYASYAIDTNILGHACQFNMPVSLGKISEGTKFPKLSEEAFSDKEKIFLHKDFNLIEEESHFEMSKADYYLFRDCLATIAGYGRETQMLDLTHTSKATGISLDFIGLEEQPLCYRIYSTATLAKEFTTGELIHHTKLKKEQIFNNLKRTQSFFNHWNEIQESYYENGENTIQIHPLWYAGRIETFGYGYFRLEPKNELWQAADLDFASQYPHDARQNCSSQQLYLAAKYQLHYKRNKDIKKLQERFWFGIESMLKGIHENNAIPDKILIYFNFIANINLKKRFHLRSTEKPIKFPKHRYWSRPKAPKKCDRLIKGSKFIFGTEIANAVIRMYELSPYFFSSIPEVNRKSKIIEWEKLSHTKKIKKIKSWLNFKEGEFLDFESSDVKDHGDETYTQLYELRKKIQLGEIEIDDPSIVQKQLKYTMNGKIGLNNEGQSKGYSGKFKCSSVPVGITGNAKLCSNIAEIYCRKWGGIPLYTHTDSLKLIASRETIERIKHLFININPLDEEAKKNEDYEDIDFIFLHGKAKYAMHCAKKDKWHLTDSGTGSYGSWLLNPIYKEFVKLIYQGKGFNYAIQKVKDNFPLSYISSLKRTRKRMPSGITTIKRIMKNKPIEVLEFNERCSVYIFKEKQIKIDKLGRERTIERKIISTSPHFGFGNFNNYHNFKIAKIDKKLIKKKKQLIKQIRKASKTNKQLRGWSKLKTIKELELALKRNYITQTISARASFTITQEAEEIAILFPHLNKLTAQHLLNLIEKLAGATDIEDIKQFDKTLIYSELKTIILEKYGDNKSLEDSLAFQDLDEEELFSELISIARESYENNKLSEEKYNKQLDEIYEQFNKERAKSKREYINPYPKAANNIIFACFAPIDFKKLINLFLNKSQTITTHERNVLTKQLKERPEAVRHLKNRFSFNTRFYQREVPIGMENRIKNIIKTKLLQNSKQKELNEYLNFKVKKVHPKLKKKIEKVYNKPSTITNLIFGKKPQFNFIELIPSKESGRNNSNMPQPDQETTYPSDGIGFSGTITFPLKDFSEYQLGNKNKAVGQSLVNTSRTLSCEYVRTHVTNKTKQKELIQNYIYDSSPEKLPCPKMGGKIHKHDNYSGTVRMKFSMLPKFSNFKDLDTANSTDFTITFYDYIQTWLQTEIIQQVGSNFLINKSKPINEVNEQIHQTKWFNETFLGREWTFEILPWRSQGSERSNGSFFIGVVAGKNRKLNYSMYFNPATNKLINFNLFPTKRFELIEESVFIKKIMKRILKTNTLTSFTRNASLTKEDTKEKKRPTSVLEKVYLCLAQVALESAVEYSTTKFFKYHITEDIELKTQDEADFTIFILNRAMQKAYSEITSQIPDLYEEVQYRKRISIGQSKQGNASALSNFPRSRSHVSYFKGEHQLINKLKRVFMDYQLPAHVFSDFRERIKLKGNIIRIETQLESYKAIMDEKSYISHEMWKELTLFALKIVRRELKKKDNIFILFDLIAEEVKPKCKEFIDYTGKDLYAITPYATKPD